MPRLAVTENGDSWMADAITRAAGEKDTQNASGQAPRAHRDRPVGGARDARDLVSANLPLVHFHARSLKARLPVADLDDLVGWGVVGLMEAAERFDGSIPFGAYARSRIRGSMLDGTHLEKGGRLRWKEGCRGVTMTSLDDAEKVPDTAERPDDRAERQELTAFVRSAMKHLPERERALVEAVYFGDASLVDAGRAAGVSRSRACHVHAKAISRLRERMERVVG